MIILAADVKTGDFLHLVHPLPGFVVGALSSTVDRTVLRTDRVRVCGTDYAVLHLDGPYNQRVNLVLDREVTIENLEA